MNIKKLTITSLLIGVLAYALIGFGVGLPEVIKALKNVKYEYLFLAVFAYAFSLLMITLRWKEITNNAGIKISTWKLYLMTLAGVTFSNITPSSRMGGEPIKAYFLNKHSGTKMKTSFATIVSARIFDAIIFMLVSIIVLSYSVINLTLPKYVSILLIISLAISVGIIWFIVYVSVQPKAAESIAIWFIRKFKRFSKTLRTEGFENKIKKEIKEYSENMNKFLKTKKLWITCSTYTILMWFFDVLRMYLIFFGLGLNTNPMMLLMVLVLSGLVGGIPVFPGGIAVTESTMIVAYNAFQIPLAVAGIATILDRMVYFWLYTFLGLIAAYKLGIKKYEKEQSKNKEF